MLAPTIAQPANTSSNRQHFQAHLASAGSYPTDSSSERPSSSKHVAACTHSPRVLQNRTSQHQASFGKGSAETLCVFSGTGAGGGRHGARLQLTCKNMHAQAMKPPTHFVTQEKKGDIHTTAHDSKSQTPARERATERPGATRACRGTWQLYN
jgi:hypothetical protein